MILMMAVFVASSLVYRVYVGLTLMDFRVYVSSAKLIRVYVAKVIVGHSWVMLLLSFRKIVKLVLKRLVMIRMNQGMSQFWWMLFGFGC